MALAVSVMAMATEEAFVKITLAGESGASSIVRLMQDDARTPEYESGYDAEKMMYQANSKSVLLYAIAGSQNLENVMTNQLLGLELGLVTNQVDQNYTLTFSNFSGNEFTIHDRVANQYITVNASTPAYAFSVEAAQVGRVAINDRFVIEAMPTEPSLCFNYNVLEINAHTGEALVVKQGDTEIANVASLPAVYSLDLSAYTGRLVVTLNGQDYQIDANPAVTKVNP